MSNAPIIQRDDWTLHYTIGDVVAAPVLVGDMVEDRHGETMIVRGGCPPHKPSSTGRVYVTLEEDRSAEFYPSVIGARWVQA